METKRPNFFIIGAAKAGTTSLYQYLAQHPDIYMSPIKEPNYFSTEINFEDVRPEVQERIKLLKIDAYLKGDMKRTIHRAFIKNQNQYESLFRFVANQKAIGEASASYLYSPEAANAIKKYNPDAKIIIVLRNPVQRIYSHYLMDRRMAITQLSFEEALLEDKNNPLKMWGSKSLYYELSEYYEQVKRYYDTFPQSNILLYLVKNFAKKH
jgi:Sulfotransferase family